MASFVVPQRYENAGLLIYWSEWQDLNLRALRPEPYYCTAYG